MNYEELEDLSLSDILRLVKAIKQSNTNPDVVRAVIESVPAEPMKNGRVTVGSINRLLRQTNGCTVLPEEIVAMLNQPEPSPAQLVMTQQHAREIMGVNFFGIEEAVQHFGVKPTAKQLEKLAQIPFDQATLEQCKNSHALVAVFPLSIVNILAKIPRDPEMFSHDNPCLGKVFASDKGEIGWHLVRKYPVGRSFDKTWSEQQDLLSEDEEVPTARVLIYTIVEHYLATGRPAGDRGKQLFKCGFVRTRPLRFNGNIISVGDFDYDYGGLNLIEDDDVDAAPRLGLASERKPL